jgi:SAM-dependent methyltransferase
VKQGGDRRSLSPEPLRVLISGAADTALTAIVAHAFRDPDTVRIVLAERCETTVQQNRLFARHLGIGLEVHPGDIRELDCAPVDAIVAHSFLNYFDDTQRDELACAWMRVLKPGGVVLLSNRLERAPHAAPDAPARADICTEGSAERLARLEARARTLHWSGADLDQLAQTALEFWRIPARRSVTEQAALGTLERAGFELLGLDYVDDVSDDPGSRPRGKSGHPRAEIVARRPQA